MMTTYRLDELAKALQSTFDGSREKIDKQQTERLSKVINIDPLGQPEFLSWECRLPSGDGGERTFEMLRLPWAGLCRTETIDIAELSIELDCKVRKTSRRKDTDQAPLTATPTKQDDPTKENTHRIKLSVNKQQPEASVSIDGATVDAFLAEQLSPEQEQKEQTRKRRNCLTAIIILASLCLVAAVTYIILYL